MKKIQKIKKYYKPFVLGLCLLLTGCGTIGIARESTFESSLENTEPQPTPDIYSSAAVGVIRSVNQEEAQLNLYLVDRKEERSFQYDGTTVVQDEYGAALSMAQLQAGEIAGITYNSELEKLGSVILSSEVWKQESMVKYNLNLGGGNAEVGGNTYHIAEDIQIFSQEKQIDADQILKDDVLSFRGMGHEIFSIIVEKGHGYLDLIHDEAVIGGWIEVGQTLIQQITEEMFLTVPEGSYQVRITANGIEETRDVIIERNKETRLSLEDIEVKAPENGQVTFRITPVDAAVYVDNSQIDTAYDIRLPLGIHHIRVSAEGYDTLSEYFNVEGELTTVSIMLEEADETTVSGNSTNSQAHTITIAAPAGAEVYQDNLYMGIAPVTYSKTTGSHTITLRKAGYLTKSYNIEVADDDRDLTYSFPDLEIDSGGSSTVSGNQAGGSTATVSGNQATVSGNQATVSGNN